MPKVIAPVVPFLPRDCINLDFGELFLFMKNAYNICRWTKRQVTKNQN
jgi:hypothetical protein